MSSVHRRPAPTARDPMTHGFRTTTFVEFDLAGTDRVIANESFYTVHIVRIAGGYT